MFSVNLVVFLKYNFVISDNLKANADASSMFRYIAIERNEIAEEAANDSDKASRKYNIFLLHLKKLCVILCPSPTKLVGKMITTS